MKKLIHASFLLLAAFVFLWPATASAQQPVLPPLPPPELQNSPPPELDALPPPSQLEWQPLEPKGAEDLSTGGEVMDVPPPKAEPSVAPPPPPPMIETFLPGGPDPSEMELVKPEVEVWRGESEWPQIPERCSNRLDDAYVTGTEPVWLRAQFNPLAAGKRVLVRPGKGITLISPATDLTISSTGECLVLAQIEGGIERSHITFYCAGAKTVLPVMRASLTTVIAAEEETGGER